MLDAIKSWAAWLWNWVTVITVAVVSFLYFGVNAAISFLSFVGVETISPVIGAERAVLIMGAVGVIKGFIAWRQSQMQPKESD